MKLTDLNPIIENRGMIKDLPYLDFDCPKCKTHRLSIPLPPSPKAWQKSGDTVQTITLSPSIAHENIDADNNSENGVGRYCSSHFYIRNGSIEMCD